ncbi:MAG: DUF4407 domain-containing protein [Blastocatellia bacterium]
MPSFTQYRFKSWSHFWWWCAGADVEILEKCGRSDWVWNVCAGVAIVLTAITASLTGGYALYTMFNSGIYALIFGVLWGMTIFNIDRFIVSSMHKEVGKNVDNDDLDKKPKPKASSNLTGNVEKSDSEKNKEYEPGGAVRFSRELWTAFPRLLLAVTLGLGLARPAELRFFESEINDQMAVSNLENAQSAAIARSQRQIDDAASQITEKRKRLDVLGEEVERLRQEYLREMDGTGGSGRYGFSVVAKQKKAEFDKAENSYTRLADELSPDIKRLETQNTAAEEKIKADTGDIEGKLSNGFLARSAALGVMKSKNQTVKWTSWFISFLICLVEALPVLIKLFSPAGAYDKRLHTRRKRNWLDENNKFRMDEKRLELENKKKEIIRQKAEQYHDNRETNRFAQKTQMDIWLDNTYYDESARARQEGISSLIENYRQGQPLPKYERPKWQEYKDYIEEYFFERPEGEFSAEDNDE